MQFLNSLKNNKLKDKMNTKNQIGFSVMLSPFPQLINRKVMKGMLCFGSETTAIHAFERI